jgi:hypothetical protein
MHTPRTTTDHDEIKRWVEAHGGCPARVKPRSGRMAQLPRIDFHQSRGRQILVPITWDAFFDAFERNHLAFRYQEDAPRGQESRVSKLIARRTTGTSSRVSGATAGHRGGAKRTTKVASPAKKRQTMPRATPKRTSNVGKRSASSSPRTLATRGGKKRAAIRRG